MIPLLNEKSSILINITPPKIREGGGSDGKCCGDKWRSRCRCNSTVPAPLCGPKWPFWGEIGSKTAATMLDVTGDSLHKVWGLEHHQVDDSDDKFWESPPRSNRLLQNIHEALRGYFLLLLLLLFCCCAITLSVILAFGLFGLFLGNPFDPLPPFSLKRSRYNLPKIESAHP